MKKFLNDVETMLDESLSGFAHCHRDIVALDSGNRFVRRVEKKRGKVALISGGGSGHEPLHAGFVGYGMLDAACAGQVFTSPTPDQMMAAAEAVDGGAGVLFIVKNYAGDVMNFSLASEMLGNVETVLVDDDVAVEKSTHSMGRRGVAGTLVVEKVLGAGAERGDSLAALKDLGTRVNSVTRSMGVALSSCTVPAAGKPTFQIADNEMEMGVGIHGEPGRRRVSPVMTADAIAEEIVHAIVEDAGSQSAGEVLLLVNGFGGTPLLELYLMYDAARRQCAKHGLQVSRSLVGNYVTSLDMAGCSITVTLLDRDITALWDAPVHTAAMRHGM
jgi:phosphoenolpyruvate---glycerone phosphotransferase subunit DhaK